MTETTFGQPTGDNKPEYRIALSVYDNKTGETVCKGTTYIDEQGGFESGSTELASLLRYFRREAKRNFEAVHYPQESHNN